MENFTALTTPALTSYQSTGDGDDGSSLTPHASCAAFYSLQIINYKCDHRSSTMKLHPADALFNFQLPA